MSISAPTYFISFHCMRPLYPILCQSTLSVIQNRLVRIQRRMCFTDTFKMRSKPILSPTYSTCTSGDIRRIFGPIHGRQDSYTSHWFLSSEYHVQCAQVKFSEQSVRKIMIWLACSHRTSKSPRISPRSPTNDFAALGVPVHQ